jgi:hypothetical protein
VQIEKFGPKFANLERALNRGIDLTQDPTGIAPDRVLVFETVGTIQKFRQAVDRVPGLRVMLDAPLAYSPDDDFAILDTRQESQGKPRFDQEVPGTLYGLMPSAEALWQLISLWNRWKNGQSLGRNYTPFRDLFASLRELRQWGPKDRIQPETILDWSEQLAAGNEELVRTELELWFNSDPVERVNAERSVRSIVDESGGRVVHSTVIADIQYHGLLIDAPRTVIQQLLAAEYTNFALAGEVMFIEPQMMFEVPNLPEEDLFQQGRESLAVTLGVPTLALLDGVPLQQHVLLRDRLVIDDPENLEELATVDRRRHGTAMASIVIYGDLNDTRATPVSRAIYLRPVLLPTERLGEFSHPDVLLVGTIHEAIVRMLGTPGRVGASPEVVIVNLSLAVRGRPFTGSMSPLGRLLDHLASAYGLLFIVSAGNYPEPFTIHGMATWTEYEDASRESREQLVLDSLLKNHYERSILSPSEAVNAIAVGALHDDQIAAESSSGNTPFIAPGLPNVSSAVGLGYRRSIKPDFLLRGGREPLRAKSSGDVLVVSPVVGGSSHGLRAASTVGGLQLTNGESLVAGTSAATALTSHYGHKILDVLEAMEGEGTFPAPLERVDRALLVKTLLVHSARWGNGAERLLELLKAVGDNRVTLDDVSRIVGFGVPDTDRLLVALGNRATAVGVGRLAPDTSQDFFLPFPECLQGVTEHRSVTITLAWFSAVGPITDEHQKISFELDLHEAPKSGIGAARSGQLQPDFHTIRRGTVLHEHYEGKWAIPRGTDWIPIRVTCRERGRDVFRATKVEFPFAVAVTLESKSPLPIYEQVRSRIGIEPIIAQTVRIEAV